MRKLFSIEGMHCAACSASIERVVGKQKGINSVNVSLLWKRMNVDFDNTLISEDEIKEIVKKAGFFALDYQNPMIDNEKEAKEKKRKKISLITSLSLLLVLLFFSMFSLKIFTLNGNITNQNEGKRILISLCIQVLLVLLIISLNKQYYLSGYKKLFHLRPNMDSLVALGSSIALLSGVVEIILFIIALSNKDLERCNYYLENIFIESSASVVCFVSIGKFIESCITSSTSSYMKTLLSMCPKKAHLVKDDCVEDIDTLLINKGDLLLIKEGEGVPADGIIVSGNASLNESALTGESLPVYKKAGDEVIAGSINYEGSFTIKVSNVGDDSTLSKVASLIEEASSSKGRYSKLADKISLYFVPIIISIAIIVFIIWLILLKDIGTALKFATSVLVISCPCAFGLATPIAVMAGFLKGAENGVLIKSTSAFEKLDNVNCLCFDKTGTLTNGDMRVIDFICFSKKKEDLLKEIYSVEIKSNHPLSKAIISFINKYKIFAEPSSNYVLYPGEGVSNSSIFIGNERLMKRDNVDISKSNNDVTKYNKNGFTVLYVSYKKTYCGYFVIGDKLKSDAKETISEITKLNISTCLISGDNKFAAEYISNECSIDSTFANVLPEGKVEIIKEKKKNYVVGFVGDGVNDSPSIATADVGIAIGTGSQISLECADIILVNNKISDLLVSIELSKKVTKNIKENLTWAFAYNIILIPIAAGVLSSLGVVLTPSIASAAMALSSISVVLNAFRIKFWKKRGSYDLYKN